MIQCGIIINFGESHGSSLGELGQDTYGINREEMISQAPERKPGYAYIYLKDLIQVTNKFKC